ncbi:MAG: ABC transporter ATP-binding protein [Bradymonadales bacterium]|nr:ABC transporter ATP-binding protein [Bradymonadales bacterium]
MENPVIQFDGVSRWYGQILGLNQVSVTLTAGITGLLGPNGAGKSTFMKLITGEINPSSGTVRVFGLPVRDNPRVSARIGYCPETDHFYEQMTALQFVTLMTRLHGYSASQARQRAQSALEEVQLAEAQDRRLATFSKGMRQKCKLAQALAHDPDLLILDEPLSGTDPASRRHLIDLIRKLALERGATVLVSSHVLYEIESMTRSMLLIHRGRILAEGSVPDLRDLIDGHPHRIRLACERSREMASLALSLPAVISVRLEGEGTVELETADPATCYREIGKLALQGGLRITSLTSPDNNMEAVFRYLVAG